MNEYIKNEIRRHIWMYENCLDETLNIVCPKAGAQIMMASIISRSNSAWTNKETLIFDLYRKGMYPEIKQPSLLQRIQMKINKCLK